MGLEAVEPRRPLAWQVPADVEFRAVQLHDGAVPAEHSDAWPDHCADHCATDLCADGGADGSTDLWADGGAVGGADGGADCWERSSD